MMGQEKGIQFIRKNPICLFVQISYRLVPISKGQADFDLSLNNKLKLVSISGRHTVDPFKPLYDLYNNMYHLNFCTKVRRKYVKKYVSKEIYLKMY